MAYEIKWSPLAKENYSDIAYYLYDNWGSESAVKFTDDLEASLKNLERLPFIGKEHPSIPSVRQLVLGKQQRLFYTVFDNVVFVLNIVNTARQT